ncbi:MAG: histidine--tRNA ligase [Hydrocarboniphaga sp.]|uniref:histidine--tRNA ligase n=1 Tax=Hydrocarboniphaga sp. TaxID=2033016 RepID=UPI002620AD83|nr:histidine--tRNA ligase [Hydrocarboniphaga sp.]MDB5971088.1 histidine--tRNA ligase [Hydrocarboniphaga sp.]
MAQKFQSVRGFNDILPADTVIWQRVEAAARETFTAYGYGEIRIPLLESTALFKRAIGDATDVVEKEMFSFDDRDSGNLTLRPEFTAGLVRAGLEHGLLHNQQQRLWCMGPVFRHERPQAGRYRQFHQLDVEAYGIPGPDVDIEIVALSARLLRRLGLADLTLELNSLGEGDARVAYRAALVEYLERYESSLDEDSRRRLKTNPLRVLDSKVPATQEIARDAPLLLDHLDSVSRAHFDALRQGLEDLGIDYVVNPRIVRGLDYYTRTVFEWTTTRLGSQGTVLAGGRYDGLVAQLGGSPSPAIGWASGIERLILLLKAQGDIEAPPLADIYVCVLGEQAQRPAARLAEQLRDSGFSVVLNVGGGKLPAQFKRADRSGARFALVLGDVEAAAEQVQVKSLRDAASPQETCTWAELPARLRSLFTVL